jgi:hypothetical protein
MAAAFMAADEGVPIGMRHLVRGVALEYGKLGRLTLETDFERFHSFVRPRGVPREEPLPASPGLQEARRLAAPDGS